MRSTRTRRCTPAWIALVASAVLTLGDGAAWADGHAEAAGQGALASAAADYAGEHFQKALYRLSAALRGCAHERCSAATRAALWRDLGTVQFRRRQPGPARKSWARALALQPDILLNQAYDAADVREAWQGAQRTAGVVPRPERLAEVSKPASSTAGETASAEPPPASQEAQSPCAPDTPGCPQKGGEPPAALATTGPVTPDEPEEARPARARFWVGVAGAVDLVVMPSTTDACRLTPALAQGASNNFYCTNPDGTDFPSATQNAHLTMPGGAGSAGAGLHAGDVRVLLALDAVVTENVLFGARFGYAFGGYTGTAAVRDGHALSAKVHGEVRGTYVFGHEPLRREGFAPVAFAAGGFSEFDAATDGTVTVDNVAGTQTVRLWLVDSPYFVAAGGGARYQFSPRISLTAAMRLNVAFGAGFLLPTFAPELTLQYGL